MAAAFAATQAEPVLASLGGGGFMLARPEHGAPTLFDFFVHTPKRKQDEASLYPIMADFGTVQQEFHIGQGSIATPGMVKGLLEAHSALGRMPIEELVDPACRLAREGIKLSPLQGYIFEVVGPIFRATETCHQLFESPDGSGHLIREGELLKNPALADFLEALAREGDDLFYRGEIAETVARDCAQQGGHLSRDDFEAYKVHRRDPLMVEYRGAKVLTNPPPSTGGLLIAFALGLLEDADLSSAGFGSSAHLEQLVEAMGLTNQARIESGLGLNDDASEKLLNPAFLEAYRQQVQGAPRAHRGTTHISVVDTEGNAAAMTLSNGEGSAYVAPGTGMVLNNMLGEEDINPLGLGGWPPDTRMSSMMAPSIVLKRDGSEVALGSGGSNRIRTAILQVVMALVDFGFSVEEAVSLPRVHFEGGLLNIEPGFQSDAVVGLQGVYENNRLWDQLNLFFGGVHAVSFDRGRGVRGAALSGGGDPRRGGTVRLV